MYMICTYIVFGSKSKNYITGEKIFTDYNILYFVYIFIHFHILNPFGILYV